MYIDQALVLKRDDTFTWDYPLQQWHHSKCGKHVPKQAGYCACRKKCPQVFLWEDVKIWIENNLTDVWEYWSWFDSDYSIRDYDEREKKRKQQLKTEVFLPDTYRIAVYWTPGNCEGYTVRIDRISRTDDKRETTALCKLFDMNEAASITDRLTRFIYTNGYS